MHKLTIALVLFAALAICPLGLADDAKAPDPEPAPPPVVDVLEKVQEINGPRYPAPPTTFRAGHVKPRASVGDAAKTDDGFRIQLPSGAPVPTPTVANGRLFVSGGFHSKEFYCFDAKTGAFQWGIDLDDDGPSAAVVEDDVVVFNTESCTVFAVDARTGKQLWSLWLGDPLMSTPAVHDGRVFTSYPAAGRFAEQKRVEPGMGAELAPKVPGETAMPIASAAPTTHVFCALDLKTGKILWQRWIDSDVMSAPVVTDGKVYATSFGGTVYAFDPASGQILSAKQYRATSAPIVVEGTVFLTRRADRNGDGVMESINGVTRDGGILFEGNKKIAKYLDKSVQGRSKYAEQGKQLDASNGFGAGAPGAANPQAAEENVGVGGVATQQAFQGSRALRLGDWNFNTMGDELVCTDPTTGDVRWSIAMKGDLEQQGGFLATSPAAAGGCLFLATLDGRVIQVAPEKGEIVKTYAVGSPVRFQPIVHEGRIYVGTQDGKVVMVDTGNPKYTGWTAWGGNGQHTGVVNPPKPAKSK